MVRSCPIILVHKAKEWVNWAIWLTLAASGIFGMCLYVLISAYCIHRDRGKCLHAVLLRIQRLAHGFQADQLMILTVSVCLERRKL